MQKELIASNDALIARSKINLDNLSELVAKLKKDKEELIAFLDRPFLD